MMPLFLLLVWLLWLRLLVLCLIKGMKMDIPVLVSIFWGIRVVFAHWVWCWQWVCHIWTLLHLSMFPLFPLCWGFFIIKRSWNLSNAFSASIDMIMWILSFILIMYWIIFIDFQILYQPWIRRTNLTLSHCMIFLMHCCIQFAIFYWAF